MQDDRRGDEIKVRGGTWVPVAGASLVQSEPFDFVLFKTYRLQSIAALSPRSNRADCRWPTISGEGAIAAHQQRYAEAKAGGES